MTLLDAITVLGISPDAPSWKTFLGKAKSAYRKLARKNHPDVGGSDEAFRRIHDALEYLKKSRTEWESKPKPERSLIEIFRLFRNLLAYYRDERLPIGHEIVLRIAHNDNERRELRDWYSMACELGYMVTNKHGDRRVRFVPPGITLARFMVAHFVRCRTASDRDAWNKVQSFYLNFRST